MRFLLISALFLFSYQSFSMQPDTPIECRSITDDTERLNCYDAFVEALEQSSIPLTDNLALGTNSLSPELAEQETAREEFRLNNQWSLSKLSSDNPNYFGFSWAPGSKNRGVETHLEFDISIKYPLLEFSERSRLFMIYNGSYDFQALTSGETYESSPVISTTQNPGAAMEWDIGDGRRKLRAGIFHHSNGQTVAEFDDPIKLARSIAEIQRLENQFGEAPSLERISRSSWYGQLRYQWMSNAQGSIDSDWSQLQLELRPFYFLNDDKLFWQTQPRHSPQIENVDGIRAVAEKMIPLDTVLPLQKVFPFLPLRGLARVEMQTGLWSPFENIGGEVSLGVNINNLLISAYYYSGFAKDISSYHKRTRHAGIGIELR